MQEQAVKKTALCGRNNIKGPERTSAVIGNICLLRALFSDGHFFFFLPHPPASCIKTQQLSNVRSMGRVSWMGDKEGYGGPAEFVWDCLTSLLPLHMEFASALKAVVVFVGQPKQGCKFSCLSLAEKLVHRIVSFCQTCPRGGQNSS